MSRPRSSLGISHERQERAHARMMERWERTKHKPKSARSKYRPKKDDDRMSAPRPYDLSDPTELARLHGELEGYMRVSLNDGTDAEGRAHAYAALCEINRRKRPAYGTPIPAETIVGAMPIND